jgi:hypothetical protein
MENRIFAKFNNYCSTAESVKETHPKIYFYLKTFAFRALFDFLSNTEPAELQKPKQELIDKYNEYIKAKANYPHSLKLSRDEYYSFLNDFFNQQNFCNKKILSIKEIDNAYLLRDLIEVAIDFGPLDQVNSERFVNCNTSITNYDYSTSKYQAQQQQLQQQTIIMNSNLAGNLRNFKNQFSIHDTQMYQQFCNEICHYIQSINNDVDNGNIELAKNKTNIAIHYLSLVKKS